MSDGIKLKIAAEAQAYEQTLARLSQLQDKYEQKLKALGGTSQKVGREEMQLNRMRERVLREIQTPLERHKQKLKELDALKAKQVITEEQYRRAVARSATQLRDAGEAGQQAGGKMEGAFGSKAIGSLKSYVMGIASVTAAIALVKGGLQEIIRMGEEAAARAKASISSFGELKQVATSDPDFANLVEQGRTVQRMGIDEAQAATLVFNARSADLTKQDALELGRMQSSGFVKDAAGIASSVKAIRFGMPDVKIGSIEGLMSKALVASGGAPAKMQEVIDATAQAAGGRGSLKDISLDDILAATPIVTSVYKDPSLAKTYIRRMLLSMAEMSAKGQDAAAGFPEAQAEYDAAVEKAESDYQFRLKYIKPGKSGAKQRESAARQREAAIAAAEEQLVEAKMASADALDFSGKTLPEIIREIDARGYNDYQLKELFGREQGVYGYKALLENMQAYEAMRTGVAGAAEAGVYRKRMGYSDPSLDAATAARAAEETRNVSRVGAGIAVNRADALQHLIEVTMREQGYGEAAIVANRYRRFATDTLDPTGRAERLATDVLNEPQAIGTRGYDAMLQTIDANRDAYGIDTEEERRTLARLLKESAEALKEAADSQQKAAASMERQAAGGTTLVAPGRAD